MNTVNVFDQALVSLGTEIANKAATQEAEANSAWEDIKSWMRMAQKMEMERKAYNLIFSSGDKVLAKKAIWYRRQKRLLKQVLEYGIDYQNLTMKEAIEAVASHREGQKSSTQKQKDALQMLERSFKGAVAHAPTERLLATLNKTISSAPKQHRAKAN